MTLPIGAASEENSHLWVREDNEHYVEPEWCSVRLFEEEPFKGNIYDPAAGFGRIPMAADRAGYEALSSDLVDRGWTTGSHNFLASKPWSFVDNVVSNPPFDQFEEFALMALKTAKRKVAMIWTVRTLPAAHWLQRTPLAKILFLTPRPSMPPGHVILRGEKPGGGKQDYCWLIWDHDYKWPNPMVGWLHRDRH